MCATSGENFITPDFLMLYVHKLFCYIPYEDYYLFYTPPFILYLATRLLGTVIGESASGFLARCVSHVWRHFSSRPILKKI